MEAPSKDPTYRTAPDSASLSKLPRVQQNSESDLISFRIQSARKSSKSSAVGAYICCHSGKKLPVRGGTETPEHAGFLTAALVAAYFRSAMAPHTFASRDAVLSTKRFPEPRVPPSSKEFPSLTRVNCWQLWNRLWGHKTMSDALCHRRRPPRRQAPMPSPSTLD